MQDVITNQHLNGSKCRCADCAIHETRMVGEDLHDSGSLHFKCNESSIISGDCCVQNGDVHDMIDPVGDGKSGASRDVQLDPAREHHLVVATLRPAVGREKARQGGGIACSIAQADISCHEGMRLAERSITLLLLC